MEAEGEMVQIKNRQALDAHILAWNNGLPNDKNQLGIFLV